MSAVLTILGVGSPFGDDRVGWSAAALLGASASVANSAGQVDVRILDRPGSLLLSEFSHAQGVIVIDALCSGAVPGTIQRLEADAVCATRALVSSHAFGVAQAVGLARSLGSLPQRFMFFGVEADRQHTGTGLSPAVSAALPQLVGQVIQQAVAWRMLAPAAAERMAG